MKNSTTFKLIAVLILAFLATTAAAQSKPASDWKAVLEAAKREGTVKCACPPRREFAVAFKKGFEDAYPGITVELTAAALPRFSPSSRQGTSRQNVSLGHLHLRARRGNIRFEKQGRIGIHVGLFALRKCSMTPRGSAASRIVFSTSNKSIFSDVFHHLRGNDQPRRRARPQDSIVRRPVKPRAQGQTGFRRSARRRIRRVLAAAVFQRYGRDG